MTPKSIMRRAMWGFSPLLTTSLLFALINAAHTQTITSEEEYRLRIKSPFAGPLFRISVDHREEFVALSSSYKSVSSWALDNPDEPVISRVPIRTEQRKRAHAVAISPSAEIIAYSVPPLGGASGSLQQGTAAIYILNRSTGRIVRTLNRTKDHIITRPQALRFSPDGEYLAATLSSGCGLRVWSTKSWELVGEDDAGYGGGDIRADRCCRRGSESECDALPDAADLLFPGVRPGAPWLITSADTGLRSYDKTAAGVVRRTFLSSDRVGLETPGGMALSPDGTRFAVGDLRKRGTGLIKLRVAIVDAKTLSVSQAPLDAAKGVSWPGFLVEQPALSDLSQISLDRVAWIAQGQQEYLFAGGFFLCDTVYPLLQITEPKSPGRDVCAARWTMGGPVDDPPMFIPIGTDRVMDLVAMPRRGGILVASQRFVGLIDVDGNPMKRNGENAFFVRNRGIDLRGSDLVFNISRNASVVAIKTYDSALNTQASLTFDVSRLRIQANETDDRAAFAPDRDPGNGIVQDERSWKNQRIMPTVLGKRISGTVVHRNEEFRSIALNRERHLFVLGSSEFLRIVRYDSDAPTEWCREPIAEDAYRVNITPDGNIVVVGHSDGTLRWYRIVELDNNRCQFKLLLSSYLSESSPGNWSWSAWRPTGEFARDLASRDSMEWQRLKSGDDVVTTPFERLQELYDWAAVTQAISSSPKTLSMGTKEKLAKNAAIKLVKLLDEPPTKLVNTERFPMRLKIEDTGSWPKNLTIVMENGTALSKTFANRSYRGWEPLVLQPSMLKENVAELDIELPASVRTTNARTNICFFLDQVLNTCEEFRWGGDLVPTKKRRLWAILVGVALHDDPRLNLSFADNDILDVAGQFVADFEKRNSAGPSDPPDFQEIRLDLILSSRPNQGDAEAKALQQGHPYVTVRQSPTKAEVLRALEEAVADRAKDRELSDDLFLFYFSGHGATIDGKMVLAMPQTRRDLENWRETALISSELLNMLKQIPGQKLVIFDACRSEVPASAELDPNAARTEFEGSVLSAFFFFSGDKGDASIEVPGLTSFNKTRPSGRQGNGLFTYAFLDGLNNKTFARRDERTHRYLIQIDSVVHYLNDEFFGSNNRAVLEQRIPRERRRNGIPIPQVYQARNSNANNKVIRTIEDVP